MPGSGWVLAAALLATPAGTPAQVYKCVDRDGTHYQSAPCAAGQETARVWPAAGYAPPQGAHGSGTGPRHATARSTPETRAPGRRRSAGRAAAGTGAGTTIGACEAAQRKRDRELSAMGKAGRKIDVRRAADAKVAIACR